MRIALLGLLVPAAVAAAPATWLKPSPLLPLSEADMASTAETGCQLAFTQGRGTYLFVIGHSLLMRTAKGLSTCTVTEAQFQEFGEKPTAILCGGRALAMRRTERVASHPDADSADGPASLTMMEGGVSRVVRGNWGSAC